MKTCPIMLNVNGRTAVVVGAGKVGLRKARALRAAGANVRLIAGEGEDIDAPGEGMEVIRQRYRGEHAAGATLVLACTDDSKLNARIADDARRAGALVNVADEPALCDFFLPATAEDGDVVVAVGTGGASPALAAALRDRVASSLPERIGKFAAALANARKQLMASVPNAGRRKQILRELAGDEAYSEFLASGEAALNNRLKQLMRQR